MGESVAGNAAVLRKKIQDMEIAEYRALIKCIIVVACVFLLLGRAWIEHSTEDETNEKR